MTVQLLRNATQWLTLGGKHILIDPMLAPKGAYPAFPGTGNDTPNPTAALPIDDAALDALLQQTDAVLLTHLHLDHWDRVAQERLCKNIPVFCQPGDADAIGQVGFTDVRTIIDRLDWDGITFYRTGGRHGTGDIGIRMGTVSGYVLEGESQRIYIAGDTIWCDEVKLALDRYQPAMVVVNGGGARFDTGDPIVMDTKDILALCDYAPAVKVYVVHLESVNHSREDRAALRAALEKAGLGARCGVPDDGEVFIR
ncbi:MBL fold metallo-hydrolase [Taibaiella koreensis]|uniref:MBL fold metallo-hydrolase n=1 Tax=Taibaiella koreensis TaxID=1268548 RepID=UPI000E59A406|nr:MBL fold metallo-hydrolase [Taibaiella koreensis]